MVLPPFAYMIEPTFCTLYNQTGSSSLVDVQKVKSCKNEVISGKVR